MLSVVMTAAVPVRHICPLLPPAQSFNTSLLICLTISGHFTHTTNLQSQKMEIDSTKSNQFSLKLELSTISGDIYGVKSGDLPQSECVWQYFDWVAQRFKMLNCEPSSGVFEL